MVAVLNEATEAGFDLQKRFLFGAMKGFMILHGEKFAETQTVQQLAFEEGLRWTEPIPDLPKSSCASNVMAGSQ